MYLSATDPSVGKCCKFVKREFKSSSLSQSCCNVLSILIDLISIPPEFFLTTFSSLIPEIFFVTG